MPAMSPRRQLVLGLFFLVAISILTFYTLFLTDFRLWGEPHVLAAEFPEANGLREGDSVLVVGKRLGKVSGIEYEPRAAANERVRVVMHLDEPVELNEGYVIAIQQATMLGGRQVYIDPGPPGAPLAVPSPGDAYPGMVERNPFAALAEVGDLFEENRAAFSSFLGNLDEVSRNLREGRGVAGRLLTDDAMADELSATLGDLRATAENVREISAGLAEGRGTVGALLTDRALYEDLVLAVGDLRAVAGDLREGRGTIGRLLRDEGLADRVEQAVNDLGDVIGRVQRGEGLAGKLLQDEEIGRELDLIVANLRSASEDVAAVASSVRRGEGTVGKLLTDDELYQEALAGVRLLTRSLEDYREAAPITAFTGVLFAAF